MSNMVRPPRPGAWVGLPWTGLVVVVLGVSGCASVAQDVDAYYRQMAVNYLEARDNAKMEATTLENESKVLAVTGESHKLKRAQRRLAKIQAWEEKCDKEAVRFEKAAEWTEAHFHLAKPAKKSDLPGQQAPEDSAVRQAAAASDDGAAH